MLEKTHDMYLGVKYGFEGGRKNMMGFSCMKHYEHTPYLHGRKILLLFPTFRCITHKKVSKPAKEIPDKEKTIDP